MVRTKGRRLQVSVGGLRRLISKDLSSLGRTTKRPIQTPVPVLEISHGPIGAEVVQRLPISQIRRRLGRC